MEIYLDNSATTRPYDEVIALMSEVQSRFYGNPSSAHLKGMEAEKLIREAREAITRVLNCKAEAVYFTSGGTEANNIAIKGVANRRHRHGKHIVTSRIEHPSVLNCCRRLQKEGFSLSCLQVDNEGYINPEELKELVKDDTILVSIIHVNNETGTLQNLAEMGPLIKRLNPQTLFHVDAVQSFGKTPITLNEWNVDLLSCSAHKIHGPKGVGALWVREDATLEPLFDGGEQERFLRPGTENVAGIAGFGLAATTALKNQAENANLIYRLKKTFYQAVYSSDIEVKLNGPPIEESAPHILNLSFPQIRAEVLLHALENWGVYISAGSACHSRHSEPSHVLKAMGIKGERLYGAVRISASQFNSEEEIHKAAGLTVKAVKEYSFE